MDSHLPHQKNNTNLPIFKSTYYMPKYREGEFGDWRIKTLPLGFDHGYFSGSWMVQDMPVLMRRNRQNPEVWDTWMSLSPHEIESQELGIKFAYGRTVVMGLGMGWVAVNAALNPNVEHVTIVEIDPAVIGLLKQSGAMDHLPAALTEKIRIIQADAKEWTPDSPIDFLYADIWRSLNESTVPEDVKAMRNNVKAKSIYFWGQELTIYTEMKKSGDTDISLTSVKHILDKMELPFHVQEDLDYPKLIQGVLENRENRRLNC